MKSSVVAAVAIMLLSLSLVRIHMLIYLYFSVCSKDPMMVFKFSIFFWLSFILFYFSLQALLMQEKIQGSIGKA